MLEEMQKIDTSVIDELMEVKKERETVADRLGKMTAEEAKVSDVVFRRVKRDYETRLSGLERKAAPLKDRGRQEFAKLKALLDRLDAQNQATKFDKEEHEFRHRLGEFEQKEYDSQLKELDAKLEEQKGHLAQAGELRSKFVAAFDSEEELVAGAPAPGAAGDQAADPNSPPPPPAVDASSVTAPQTVPPPPIRLGASEPGAMEGGPGAPPPPVSDTAGTVMLKTPAGVAAPPANPAAAKLVAIDDDLGAKEFALQPQTFVGRTPDNHVRINKPTVSRRHAQLSFGDKGWSVKDLRSENGTYLNKEKITERQLADGDKVTFGTVELVFRIG